MLQDDRIKYEMGREVKDPMQEAINNLMGLGVSKEEVNIIQNNTMSSPEVRKIINRVEKETGAEPGNVFSVFNMIAKKEKEERAGMKDGGKGIEALRKVAPEVVERMGYEEGGPMMDKPMMDKPMMDEPMMDESMVEEPMMEQPEEDDMMPEEDMLPDDKMEDEYLDFILDEALDSEEEDYLMSQLQDNERLSEIFDKVIDIAQEFAGSGPVEGPGSGVSDSIPARLSDGEFVFTAKAVEEIGADNLMAMMKDAEMKADDRQGLAEGGMPEEEETVVMPVEQPASQQDIRVTKTTVGAQASQQEQDDLVGEEVKKSMLRGSRNLG
jgi:hypothetical protein